MTISFDGAHRAGRILRGHGLQPGADGQHAVATGGPRRAVGVTCPGALRDQRSDRAPVLAGHLLNRPTGPQVRLQSRQDAVTAHPTNYLETGNPILPQPARRACMTAGFSLAIAAECRGVPPMTFLALTSAPASNRACITAGFSLAIAARRRRASTPEGSGITQKRGSTWPRGASAPPLQPAWASAMRRAAGCGRPWSPWASPRSVSGTQGCS